MPTLIIFDLRNSCDDVLHDLDLTPVNMLSVLLTNLYFEIMQFRIDISRPDVFQGTHEVPHTDYLGDLYTESGQTLQGSFPAVWKQASTVVQSLSICK